MEFNQMILKLTITAVASCIPIVVQVRATAAVPETWLPAKEGVEYRVRQEQSQWRVNEIPLLYLDLRNRGTRRDLCVELDQSQHRLVVQNKDYQKGKPWAGVERLEPHGKHVTIKFTLCDWTRHNEATRGLTFGVGKHNFQFKVHIASYAPEGSGDAKRDEPFDFVTDATEIELVRVDAEANATKTMLKNIRRELIAFTCFHTPVVSPTLSRLFQENLPQSSAYLIDVIKSSDQSLHWPAAVTFAKHWHIIPHRHIEEYLKASLKHRVKLRAVYPQGVDAAIQLGYWFQPGYLGMPGDKDYRIETKTMHYLDDRAYGEPFSYYGVGATTHWIPTKNLVDGPHRIRVVTEYRFSRRDFTCSDRVESRRFNFEIGSPQLDDDLLAPLDADVDRLVRDSFKIAETEEDFAHYSWRNFRRYAGSNPWQAQIRRTSKDGTSSSFRTPVWKLTEELPVDLCFRVSIQLATEIVDCGQIVVLKGEAGQGYFSPRDFQGLDTILNDQNEHGQVPARIILKPSRGVALSDPKVTSYYNGEIVSPRMSIFVNGAKPAR